MTADVANDLPYALWNVDLNGRPVSDVQAVPRRCASYLRNDAHDSPRTEVAGLK